MRGVLSPRALRLRYMRWRSLRGRSLRWRLVLLGALALAGVLGLSAAGLALLFERHVERVSIADLEARALTLAAMVEPAARGGPALREAPGDPFYDQPFSGHYWQLHLGNDLRRSRSLWDYTLPDDGADFVAGTTRVFAPKGPQGETLLAVEQNLTVGADAVPLRIVVATDREVLNLAQSGFLADLLPYVALLGGLLILASWGQITLGLRPLAQVSGRVSDLTSGVRRRIGDDLPTEVTALAHEIDKLLDAREAELARARHRAADLAHGFKTPLQALLGDAGQLRDRDEWEIADSVETIALSMRRLVDRELTRARIQADHSASEADPAAILGKIIEVLRRTPDGGRIDWQVQAAAGLRARIDPDDLTEALGALSENAMRHARSEVTATIAQRDGRVVVAIRDDGPGVPEAMLSELGRRGLRLDEGGDGQGIGLALVFDITEAAEGDLRISNARPGLLVELSLLAAPVRRHVAGPGPK